jgi:H+/Cl- antiporter ClcA
MLNPKRPLIEIEKSQTDILFEILTFMLVAGAAGLIGWYYNQLPDQIPIHFNWPSKDANGFGSKSLLWMSPIICGIIVIGLYILNHFPRIFNYPVKITEENAEYQYEQATQMIRVLNLIIGFLCLSVTATSIANGLGSETDFDLYLNILFPVLLIGTPIFFALRMVLKKKKAKTERA